ncbi:MULTISPECIES: hemerythrin domain-containing protein [unclassified Mesorhizobium]|uniref:hemerythrin domain-containing protein n=1 Tax=unclassified Mesorhizobium TaxID=325217 RepID=UPI00301467CF
MSDHKAVQPYAFDMQWNGDARHAMELLPAAMMKRAHLEKLRLCESLEDIADTLPGHIDQLQCLSVANALVPLLRSVHRYEETVVFPAFETALGKVGKAPTIQRLRAEHVEDECFADDVTEILLAIGHGEAIENPEALGFMLRGLFETIRRHVAFECEHVLPAISVL